MFYAKVNGQASVPDGFVARARDFGASAGQTAATAAQTAVVGVNKGIRQGVYSVRVWTAPRLESVADYTTTTFAPKVSSALRGTARQVQPVEVSRRRIPSVLTWSLLAAAVLAAAGAVAAMVRYRYRAAMMAEVDEEEFEPVGQPGETTTRPATPAATASGSSPGDSGSTDTEVTGRVPASGW